MQKTYAVRKHFVFHAFFRVFMFFTILQFSRFLCFFESVFTYFEILLISSMLFTFFMCLQCTFLRKYSSLDCQTHQQRNETTGWSVKTAKEKGNETKQKRRRKCLEFVGGGKVPQNRPWNNEILSILAGRQSPPGRLFE